MKISEIMTDKSRYDINIINFLFMRSDYLTIGAGFMFRGEIRYLKKVNNFAYVSPTVRTACTFSAGQKISAQKVS